MTDDDELRSRLRDADPARTIPPAEPDRVSRLLEDAMRDEAVTESRASGARGRSRTTWLVAAAAGVLIGMVAAYVLVRAPVATLPLEEEGPVTTLELALPAGTAGRCMTPTPSALSRAEVAFEGTATDVAEGRVRLEPSQFYAGGPADRVEVAQAGRSQQDLILAVRFEEGGRYLVAANGGKVMVCGFSGAFDDRLAGLYARAFAR